MVCNNGQMCWNSMTSKSRTRSLHSVCKAASGLSQARYITLLTRAAFGANNHDFLSYSHSIVPGGLLVMSYVTRLIPRTSFTIRVATRAKNSMLNG